MPASSPRVPVIGVFDASTVTSRTPSPRSSRQRRHQMIYLTRDNQAVIPEGYVHAPRPVVDRRDRDDLRQAVEIGIAAVAERAGVAAEEPGGLQGRDAGIK